MTDISVGHPGSVLTCAGLFKWQESDRRRVIEGGPPGAGGRVLPVIPAQRVVRLDVVLYQEAAFERGALTWGRNLGWRPWLGLWLVLAGRSRGVRQWILLDRACGEGDGVGVDRRVGVSVVIGRGCRSGGWRSAR
jgi:hypothetical protein